MEKEQIMTEETLDYARKVYAQMHGFYKAGTVAGVRDETEGGALGKCYEEIYNALERLGDRCGFDVDDKDRNILLDALEEMLLESGVKMFEY